MGDGLALAAGVVFWLRSWEPLATTGQAGTSRSATLNLSLESVVQKKTPLLSVRHHEDRRGSRCSECLGRRLLYVLRHIGMWEN